MRRLRRDRRGFAKLEFMFVLFGIAVGAAASYKGAFHRPTDAAGPSPPAAPSGVIAMASTAVPATPASSAAPPKTTATPSVATSGEPSPFDDGTGIAGTFNSPALGVRGAPLPGFIASTSAPRDAPAIGGVPPRGNAAPIDDGVSDGAAARTAPANDARGAARAGTAPKGAAGRRSKR